MKIAIIDYGAGNVANVRNAFQRLCSGAVITSSGKGIADADGVVLPGVGNFGQMMRKLGKGAEVIRDLVENGKPYLGICLGMQGLFENSEEAKGVNGLGVFRGNVRKFRVKLPVPEMGWNLVSISSSAIFDGMEDFYAYFAHSYYCLPVEKRIVASKTRYGIEFASALAKKNIFATQFHPEKSGRSGLRLLENFIREVKK